MFWVVMVHQAIDGACADVTTDKYQNSLFFSHVFFIMSLMNVLMYLTSSVISPTINCCEPSLIL